MSWSITNFCHGIKKQNEQELALYLQNPYSNKSFTLNIIKSIKAICNERMCKLVFRIYSLNLCAEKKFYSESSK